MEGQVIGINTAIFSPTGGSVGLGFRHPGEPRAGGCSAQGVNGGVERGLLGVQVSRWADPL